MGFSLFLIVQVSDLPSRRASMRASTAVFNNEPSGHLGLGSLSNCCNTSMLKSIRQLPCLWTDSLLRVVCGDPVRVSEHHQAPLSNTDVAIRKSRSTPVLSYSICRGARTDSETAIVRNGTKLDDGTLTGRLVGRQAALWRGVAAPVGAGSIYAELQP